MDGWMDGWMDRWTCQHCILWAILLVQIRLCA